MAPPLSFSAIVAFVTSYLVKAATPSADRIQKSGEQTWKIAAIRLYIYG